MQLIDIESVTVHFGSDPVLDGASLTVLPGEKIGLIGANGAGKSTLIRVLTGEIEPDEAKRLARIPSDRIAVVAQHFPKTATGTAVEFLTTDAQRQRVELERMEANMAHATGATLDRLLKRYGDAREAYDRTDGDAAEERARTTLATVGMEGAGETDVRTLSGGERNRLQIAAALMRRPDLLVLDEPGNHLDAWGLAWLEETLANLPSAVLVVSHNRYLLDRVATRIVELRSGTTASWSGNYSAYRAARLREAVARARDARADEKRLSRLEEMVRKLADLARNRADPAIGQRLRARRTQLERVRAEARTRPDLSDERAQVRLAGTAGKANIALDVQGYSRAVKQEDGDRMLLEDTAVLIEAGERVALLGPNGCGKTTLIRDIVGAASWDHAHLRLGPSMRIGYCPQHPELLDGTRSIEENLVPLGAFNREKIFQTLSRYRFAYKDMERPVATLSGGELNRLHLARAELIGANFLVLDEPTNHMDIAGREVVEEALAEFDGTVLMVSHDRYFLDAVATRVVAFEERSLVSYPGTFSDYWFSTGRFWNQTSRTGGERPAQRREDGDGASVEDRLLRAEAEKIAIEKQLATAYERDDLGAAARLSKRLDRVTRIYEDLYERWGG